VVEEGVVVVVGLVVVRVVVGLLLNIFKGNCCKF
jgi:hypothetical protein